MSAIKVLETDYVIDGSTTTCTLMVALKSYPQSSKGINGIQQVCNYGAMSVSAKTICNEKDVYDEELGKRIAFTKAIMKAKMRWINMLESIKDDIDFERKNIRNQIDLLDESDDASSFYYDMLISKIQSKEE